MSTPDFEVTIAGQSDRAEVLALLTDGYGRPFLADWFEWKHVQGPWGPSVCFVARDRDGLLGVAFRMPWPLLAGDTPVKASRLVDGTTSPRALRRGVFREVVRNMLTRWDEEEPSEVVLATATPPALAAHVKNGATALEPIEFSYRPVRHARAHLLRGESAVDRFSLNGDARLATRWSSNALRWRADPRSGAEYKFSSLANSSTDNGAMYRSVRRHGLCVVSIARIWGTERDRSALVRAIAADERAVAVHQPGGPGTPSKRPLIGLRRGRSLLCTWQPLAGTIPSEVLNDSSAWSLEGVDLEGLI